jgi:site-specific DNA-methyltransferase (adenine-specific)
VFDPYWSEGPLAIYAGDCIEVMAGMEAESVDAIVTDPPYGLEFMGKTWDTLGGDGWRTGGGFSKPGIGERSTAWASFGSGDTANATCATCGGRMRGSNRCKCDEPQWRVKGKPLDETRADSRMAQGRKMQAWHERWAREALCVAKPGAHLLAFGGTRTYHRLACAIEDAGWEIRDCLVWGYASGFPKSLNLDGDRKGWGTALKPAWEPIVLARKPLRGTVAANVAAYGTGALNIDATRIPLTAGEAPDDRNSESTEGKRYGDGPGDFSATPGRRIRGPQSDPRRRSGVVGTDLGISNASVDAFRQAQAESTERLATMGRWPANVVLTDPVFDGDYPDGVVGGGERKSGAMRAGTRRSTQSIDYGVMPEVATLSDTYGDAGGVSRFFLIPKASRADREPVGSSGERVNTHPTVKPTALMRHLVRLVTPPGGVVLDPFAGSGTTLLAALDEGFGCIGIERDDEYARISVQRIEAAMEADRAAQARGVQNSIWQ